jgi:hypothetical protein
MRSLTRDHDVVYRDPLKVENAHQHLLVTARNHQTRFGDDGAQLFARQRVLLSLPIDVQAHEPQRAVGNPVDRIHRRAQYPLQRGVGVGRGGG